MATERDAGGGGGGTEDHAPALRSFRSLNGQGQEESNGWVGEDGVETVEEVLEGMHTHDEDNDDAVANKDGNKKSTPGVPSSQIMQQGQQRQHEQDVGEDPVYDDAFAHEDDCHQSLSPDTSAEQPRSHHTTTNSRSGSTSPSLKVWPKPPTYTEQHILRTFVHTGVLLKSPPKKTPEPEEEESSPLRTPTPIPDAHERQTTKGWRIPGGIHTTAAATNATHNPPHSLRVPSIDHVVETDFSQLQTEERQEAHVRRLRNFKPRGPMFGDIDLREPVHLMGLGPDVERTFVREEAVKFHKRKDYGSTVRTTKTHSRRSISLSPS